MAVAVMVIAGAVLETTQLSGQFARHQINAGVEVFAAFLGPDHGAIGEHRDLGRLLRNSGVAGHREVNIRFLDKIVEVMNGPVKLGFGVIPQCGRHIQVATMDQQLHASLRCLVLSAS